MDTPNTSNCGVVLVSNERERLRKLHGDVGDDRCTRDELLRAAECYAQEGGIEIPGPVAFPWPAGAFQPSEDRIGNLVKAGGLLVSEQARRNRAGEMGEANDVASLLKQVINAIDSELAKSAPPPPAQQNYALFFNEIQSSKAHPSREACWIEAYERKVVIEGRLGAQGEYCQAMLAGWEIKEVY